MCSTVQPIHGVLAQAILERLRFLYKVRLGSVSVYTVVCLSIDRAVYLFIDRVVCLSIDGAAYLFIDRAVCLSIDRAVRL